MRQPTAMQLLLLLAAAVCTSLASASGAQYFVHVTPSTLDVSEKNGTLHLYRVMPHTRAFLLQRPTGGLGFGYNCSHPPPPSDDNRRTHVETVEANGNVHFGIARLHPGTYYICFKNTTAGGPEGTYRPLVSTIAVVETRVCSGGAHGICDIRPRTTSGRLNNQTFQLFYAPFGTRVFLMNPFWHGVQRFSCTSPPAVGASRTVMYVVGADGIVDIDVFGLEPGNHYRFCHLNSTSPADPNNPLNYGPLDPIIVVAGDVSPEHSAVSCCDGPFVVGFATHCTITAVDSSGNPAGIPSDVCRFDHCPMIDGRGRDITRKSDIGFVKLGEYAFTFVAEGAGCGASVGVTFGGIALGNKVNYLTLHPSNIVSNHSTALCGVSGSSVLCNVTKRDRFHNPVQTCSMLGSGKIHCHGPPHPTGGSS